MTFNIWTDVPCDNMSATAINVGLEGETERAAPVKIVTDCNHDVVMSAIGTYVVKPGAKKDVTASFKVALAIGKGGDVESTCIASKKYRGCTVARRRVVFVPHHNLQVPVSLKLGCVNVQCDQNSSCTGTGQCSTSEVDTAQCSNGDV